MFGRFFICCNNASFQSNPPNDTKLESAAKKAVWHWQRRFVTFFMATYSALLQQMLVPHTCATFGKVRKQAF